MSTQEHVRHESSEAAPGAATLCEAFQATAARSPDAVALRTADDSTSVTWGEYAERVRRIAAGLAVLGIGRGDTVGLMLTNRPEFHLIDTAAFHLGATPFSIYGTFTPEQISYLFSNAANRVVFTDAASLRPIQAAGAPDHVVCVDSPAPEGTISLEELEALGAADFDFAAAWRAVEPDDVLTLIYTSGTTGPPKGVEITHANMLAQCRAVASVLGIEPGDRITSYLPSAHIADRWSSHYNGIVFGVQITSVADLRAIAQALPAVKPTIWGGVPRVVEKLKAAIEAGLAAEPDEAKRAGAQAAIAAGIEKVRLEQAGAPVPDELAARCAKFEELVFAPLRAKLGLDEARWIMIGAAPLSRDVHEFLLALGLPVLELYGMSECSCVVSACAPSEARVGTVGRLLPGLEASVADDGELLVRGPTVMRGYRGEAEKTAEAVDADGWLHTGDIAAIDPDGHVRIVDRKKELIINAGGKNMSPANIEGELKDASPLIGQAVAIGDRRPYNVALLVLDPDAAAAHAKAAGLDDPSVAAVAADPGVRRLVAAAIAAANENLARVEQIKRYELLAEEWLPSGDELTPTMKLKRKPIDAKYADVIESLYAD
jgi:long-subunit acyl-CoA synthetase (AMP-forming)